MASLLPPNATQLERDIETVTARNTELPVPIRESWNAQTCPAHLLPWLAWALSVDNWSSDWTEQQQRDAVEESITIHRRKGTLGALKRALATLDIETEVSEPWQSGDAPHSFRVSALISQRGINRQTINDVTQVVNRNKPIRSNPILELVLNSEGEVNTTLLGASASITTISPYIVTELNAGGEIHMATAFSAAAITTVYPYSIAELQANGQYTIGVSAVCTPINLVEAYNA